MTYRDGKINPLDDNNLDPTPAGDVIFGEHIEIPPSGRRVAKPADVLAIWPDPKQPRRAIPVSVRVGFDGDPLKLGDVLMRWFLRVKDLVEELPTMPDMLTGLEEWPGEGDPRGVVQSFGELVNLAAGIYRDGLINPITIYEAGEKLWCLTGERRLLAHHLLMMYVDREAYGRVLAVKTDYSVMQQVAENTQRRDLNAIGMARCYALVVMELGRAEGKRFSDYETMTATGRSDLWFYGQAAEISLYGRGKDIQGALNVNNRESIRQYRLMLTLPEDVWQEADDNDWSLRECMDWFEARKIKDAPAPPPSPEPGAGSTRKMDQTDVLVDNAALKNDAESLKQNSNGNVNRDWHFPSADGTKTAESGVIDDSEVTKNKQTDGDDVSDDFIPEQYSLQYWKAHQVMELIHRRVDWFAPDCTEESGDIDVLLNYYDKMTSDKLQQELARKGQDAFIADADDFINMVEDQMTGFWEEFCLFMDRLMDEARELE